jgi:hypothetical protein
MSKSNGFTVLRFMGLIASTTHCPACTLLCWSTQSDLTQNAAKGEEVYREANWRDDDG